MCFFLKYLVTLFYKKLRKKIVVSFLRESGPRHLGGAFALGRDCLQQSDQLIRRPKCK